MIEDYEEFSESQIKILEHFVTNSNSNVFVLRNLPEVIKGALFSRYFPIKFRFAFFVVEGIYFK